MEVGGLTWCLDHDESNGGVVGVRPEQSTPGAMAFDFYSPLDYLVPAATKNETPLKGGARIGKLVINTLVSVILPEGCAMILGSRSGLAAKHRITVEAGWIDNDYRGHIGVVLYNHGSEVYIIKAGDRIAQGMLVPVLTPRLISVEYGKANASTTVRGAGGFGSTGR